MESGIIGAFWGDQFTARPHLTDDVDHFLFYDVAR
jgi:hypothetical protein